jgi:hypothetical protein
MPSLPQKHNPIPISTLTNPFPSDQSQQHLSSRPRRPKNEAAASYDPSEPSPTNAASTDSQSKDFRVKLLRYLLAFFNRELPTSSKDPSLIGTVLSGVDPKTATSKSWHLTYDNSLAPHRSDLLENFGLGFDEHKLVSRNVGAEPVSQS